nr:hypothetical protein [Saprospiraceae bacterium]
MQNKKTSIFSSPSRISDHIIQGVLIFASVFLAFLLNEVRVNQIERNEAERVLNAVIGEIQSNLDILERWAPRHLELSEKTKHLIDASGDELSEFRLDELDTEGRGILREILTYDGWDFLRYNDAKIEINKRLQIYRIYRQQEYVDQAVNNTIEFLADRTLMDPELALENHYIFYRLITELYYQELAMIKNYKLVLEKLTQ